MKTELSELLKEMDKTAEIWDNIPKEPLVLDEECIDWADDDWTVQSSCTRPDLWTCMKTTGKPIVLPKISYYF